MSDARGNILDLIGSTPLVEIRRLNTAKNVKVFAKLESFNPGGSIKDRAALFMIEQAEKRGVLSRDKTILEATSGNTGIGLALVAAAKGYKLMLVLSESVSEERKKILKALGAELHFTPARLGTDGAIEVVYEMMRENPNAYFVPDQFNNEDNVLAHYYGTAEEIWRQTDGGVTMVVSALGTTGTAMGISRRLKELKSSVRIVGVEPYLHHRIQGLKNMKESYRPGIFERSRLDEKVNVHDDDAFRTARAMAREEGLFVGMSSGAAVFAALTLAKAMPEGVIVAICPDSGERYLSTELFADRGETTLRIYNTLTKARDSFRPLTPEMVRMHSCGPTVHEVPHIGTYRRFVVADMIMRYLKFRGYRVTHVTNIIDMADRSIKGADQAGMDVREYTERFVQVFRDDARKLNIGDGNPYPRASGHVEDMIALTEKLVDKGFAYEKLRSVYFDISRLEGYGALSRIDLERARHTQTIDNDDYEKDNPADFTLLKRSTLAELKKGIFFKTKWGNVRPGWHLECAAISMKYLSANFDIYVSGTDIIFPHCENVMAIGRAATGKNLANYWVNSDLVMSEGKKMSRSLQNVFTVEDLEKKGYKGTEIRYFLLSTHYRKPLHFSLGALDTARNTVRRLNDFIHRLIHFTPGEGCGEIDQLIYDVMKGFGDAMDDDFNISGAMAALSDFTRVVNAHLARNRLNQAERDGVMDTLRKIDTVLGMLTFEEDMLSEEARRLIGVREEARRRRAWDESDRLRRELLKMGIVVHDTPAGTTWTLRQP
ncbi:MAG: cysteine--tRNA ligase [Deltaproteobacteria bacterium]|nr:cysteine--tRNA ligase [Deltaproteobacteria bacterium]